MKLVGHQRVKHTKREKHLFIEQYIITALSFLTAWWVGRSQIFLTKLKVPIYDIKQTGILPLWVYIQTRHRLRPTELGLYPHVKGNASIPFFNRLSNEPALPWMTFFQPSNFFSFNVQMSISWFYIGLRQNVSECSSILTDRLWTLTEEWSWQVLCNYHTTNSQQHINDDL